MNNIPGWFIDPNSIKANEFEHGLMLGYMLLPDRAKKSGFPKDGTNELTLPDGSVLKTWVEKTYDNVVNSEYVEAYGIFQKLTYADGTVEEWNIEDFTTEYRYTGAVMISKGTWLGWELAEPVSGIIGSWYYYIYNTRTNKIEKNKHSGLQWGIPVEV